MENQWLAYAKRLQAIASTGLHYTKDEFDRERYREIGEIANGMLADTRQQTLPAFSLGSRDKVQELASHRQPA